MLLPGGDIDPVLFGESDHGSRKIEPGLDRKQLAMLDAFVRLQAGPGICKGMQIINVYFGGGVIQDLPTNYAHQYDGRDQVHPSHAAPDPYFIGCTAQILM
ncbi:MAG: gamma-glutamyl-gamma-aminobutyrate hydrolase family protein [Eisenbergiella sp.]